jgi:hypothetical protein
MPAALLKVCTGKGGTCGALTACGRCRDCERDRQRQCDATRGTASERGYDVRWAAFRRRFYWLLGRAGILAECGASLPGGPDVRAKSRCMANRQHTLKGLHLHHEPPLTDAERKDQRAVCDPMRVAFLCHGCHSGVTREQQRQGLV